jgi:16S rRNA (uracil1498-N3)-methyltransferase
MNLILLEPEEVGPDGAVALSGARGMHLRTVLKVVPGDVVRVGMIDGPAGLGTVVAVAAEHVEARCAFDAAVPERPRVDLLLAVPRPKVMRRLWAPLAALGVGQVILTSAERVERDYFGAHVLDEKTYRPLLLEGLQQAKDTRLPAVSVHRRFKPLVEDDLDRLCPDALRIVAHPAAQDHADRSVAGALSGIGDRRRVLVAAGPEGGWNGFELALLETHGFTTVSMGPRPLATATACVALLALVHDALRQG